MYENPYEIISKNGKPTAHNNYLVLDLSEPSPVELVAILEYISLLSNTGYETEAEELQEVIGVFQSDLYWYVVWGEYEWGPMSYKHAIELHGYMAQKGNNPVVEGRTL